MARRCCRATSRYATKTRTHPKHSAVLIFMSYMCLLFPITADAGLYTSSDQIIVLTPDNVDSVVFNSTAALVVEFYASWCGHCVAFSPIWKSLARDMKEWKPAVDLAAIDCADEDNRKVCTNFGIKGYPSLKFFHAYSSSTAKGQDFRGFPRDVRGLRHQIIEKMETHEEFWPPACPPLETASKVEIDSFFETNSVEHLALVFERENSYVGREVILDLLQYENIAVRRVLSTEDGLVSKLGVADFPSCYLYYPNGNFSRLIVHSEARTFYSYALQRLPRVARSGRPYPVISDLYRNSTQEQWKPFNRSRVYMSDLESALHYSLRVELAAHPVFSGEDLSALNRYVSVLAKHFPGRPMVRNLLRSVDTWLQGRGQAELRYSSLRERLDSTTETPDAVLPEGVRWVGCQGSQSHFRGYPCSVWTLFHVLTVQAKNTAASEPQEVLQALRGYVHSFFGCRPCATHFESMARESMDQVTTATSAVLWLWSRHNRVNNRLAGALSEDPHFPKVQWPSPELCPSCHAVKRSGEHTWNQEEVLAFLRSHFSSDHILPDYLEEEAQLLSQQKERLAAMRAEKEKEAKRGAERRAREAQDTAGGGPEAGQEEEEEDEEEEEEGAQEELAPEGEEIGVKGKPDAAAVPGPSAPPPWVRPRAERQARSRRPSIVGLKLREPQEDIVDLDSFVNQHYKAKALRAAAAAGRIHRRSLQRKDEALLLRPAEVDDFTMERKRLQKRGLAGEYMGLEEDELYAPQQAHRKRWMSLLNVGFSSLDISLCLLLYLLSSMCLLAMYLYFKMRHRLRRAKVALP